MAEYDIADPNDPNTLVLPFIFVPHGDPWPTEWLRAHPGAVRIPATFVPRAPAAGQIGTRMDVSLAAPVPVAQAAAPAGAAAMPGGFAPIRRSSAWPVDRSGRPWPRTLYGQPQRPLHEFAPGERAPGEAAPPEYRTIAEADAVAAYRAAEAVFADPGGAAGVDYSDVIRILREIEQAPLLAAAQVRASSATQAAGAKAAPPSAVPGQLDPRWVKTADDNLHNPAASAYDQTIRDEIAEYNRRFAGIPGFSKLDPNLFKAQLLTETGPANPQWLTLSAQIGKPGDQAYGVLKRNEQASDVVMGERLQREIATKPITDPILNVKAAIAYVLTRAAHTRLVSRRDATDTSEHKHIVKKGEVLGTIARIEHTTVSELSADNLWSTNGIHEGQILTFHRASMVREIYQFDRLDVQFIATQSNSMERDPNYAAKMNYVLGRMQ